MTVILLRLFFYTSSTDRRYGTRKEYRVPLSRGTRERETHYPTRVSFCRKNTHFVKGYALYTRVFFHRFVNKLPTSSTGYGDWHAVGRFISSCHGLLHELRFKLIRDVQQALIDRVRVPSIGRRNVSVPVCLLGPGHGNFQQRI
jgi:hypothetical protein